LAFQERKISLLTGPGGELDAIRQISDLRRSTAEEMFRLTGDQFDRDRRGREIERQEVISLLELQKQKVNEYRETAGRVFDALKMRGGSGLTDFFRAQGDILQRQIFVNASERVFTSLGSTFGQVGKASGLGSLLRGTIFDPQNAQLATKLNTTATEDNTAAIREHSALLAGRAGGSTIGDYNAFSDYGGGVSEVTNLASQGNRVLSRIPGAATAAGRIGGFLGGLGTTFSGGLFAGLRSGGYSIQTGDGQARVASGAERAGNIAGSAALLAGSAVGVVSGLREGGARGTVTAVGAALGAASAIPGPQQPILQAAALVAGLVRGLFPDPKQEREKQIQRTIENARYEDPEAKNRSIDLGGNEFDYDKRGNMRPIVVNVTAMDAKSFLDRKQDIAQAVHGALLDGGTDLADSIRNISSGG
jgi:hypothetical protein